MTPSLKHRLQYGTLRAVVLVVSLLPWRIAGACGGWLGRLGYWPLRLRRTVVEQQLEASFPELDAPARRRIAIDAYSNLGRVAFETALLSKQPQGKVLELFHPAVGWEHLENGLAQGRGLLLVSGHIGNWELGAAYVAQRVAGADAIVRGMTNPLFNAYITRSRRRFGYDVVSDQDAVRRMPRALSEGRVILILADQGGKGLSSTYVPFFNRPARTPRGPAVFALRLGTPTVCAAIIRQPDGRYRMHIEPVVVTKTGDRERDVDTIVANYTRQIETWVRQYPGQYLWQHRRWKRPPPGETDARPETPAPGLTPQA